MAELNLSDIQNQSSDITPEQDENFTEVSLENLSVNLPDFSNERIFQGNIEEFRQNVGSFVPEGGFEALRRQRAINQSTGEQLSNSAIKMLPAVGLGILENAGYLLEVPNALFGERKDFTNGLVEFAKRNRQSLEEALPVFRENPEEVFDLTDNAWWVQHGSGLVESIGEFLATGVGVGSALGKGATTTARALNLGAKASGALQSGAQVLTSASLAYTEGAMSGAEIYKEVYNDATKRGLSDSDANKLASKAASKTVRMNTLVNTALNLTSVAPLFNKNILKSSRLKLERLKGESVPAYKARIAAIADDPLNGFKPNTKQALIREVLQEGLEEQVNLAAEVEGRLEGKLITEEQAGGKNVLDRFLKSSLSEEGALNFMLGAIGGAGQTGGIALATRAGQEAQLDQISQERVKAISDIQDTLGKIENTQIELQTEASKPTPDLQKVSELKDNLFDHNTTYHFKKGSEDALIGTMEQVAAVDNVTDLGIEIAKQRDTLIQQSDDIKSQIESLQQSEQTPETVAQIAQLTDQLVATNDQISVLNQEFAEKSGQTEAMQQGLAVDPTDNKYKETALGKKDDILRYKSIYRDLAVNYNTTQNRQLADVASNILDREISKDRYNKRIDDVNTELDFVKNTESGRVAAQSKDEFVNDLFLLEGKLKALENIKKGKLSKKNLESVNNQIDDVEAQIQSLIDNDLGEGKSIIDKQEDVDNGDELRDQYTELYEKTIDGENQINDLNSEIFDIKANPERTLVNPLLRKLDKEAKRLQKIEEEKISNERKEVKAAEEAADPLFGTEGVVDETITQEEQITGEVPSEGDISEQEVDVDPVPAEELLEDLETSAQVEEGVELVEEPYFENTNFSNNPTEGLSTEEQEELGETRLKIVEAAKSVAYRVKSFEIKDGVKRTDSNILEKDLNKGVLVEGNYLEGDNVVIEVDRDYSITDEDNITTTFNDILEGAKKSGIDPILVYPMKITHSDTGEIIGYLHDINYMNSKSVASGEGLENNIEIQKELITDLRNKVVKSGDTLETTISNVRGGSVLSKNVERGPAGNLTRPSSEVFNNPELEFGVIGLTDEGVQSRGTDIKTRNSQDFISDNLGKVVVLLPDVNGDIIAAPLSVNKLSDEVIETFINFINLKSIPDEQLSDNERSVLDQISNDFDIKGIKGLKSILESYVYLNSLTNSEINDIKTKKNPNSRKRYLNVSTKGVSLQQEGRSPIVINSTLNESDKNKVRTFFKRSLFQH